MGLSSKNILQQLSGAFGVRFASVLRKLRTASCVGARRPRQPFSVSPHPTLFFLCTFILSLYLYKMKKIVFILAIALFSFNQVVKAQCAYTHFEVGNTTTLSYMWPIALIYTLDSVRINFGDGNSILQTMPVPSMAQHTYANPGVYNVCLTRYLSMIGNPTPIPCTYCDSIYIGGLPTNCNASSSFFFVNNGLSYNFISSGTCLNCATTQYTWDFGDGTILTNGTANETHNYAAPGFYNVCLTINGVAANNTTCTNTSCQAIAVTANPAPCAATASFTNTINGQTVNFNNTSSCFNCAITSYVWDFGDGSVPNNTPNPSHTYANPGTYTVCVTMTGMDSLNIGTCVDDTCVVITVAGIPPCTAVSNFSNTNNVNIVQFNFTGSCTGCATSTYAWNFGDGGTSSLPNPSHTYAANGNYNVCLTLNATNANNLPCTNQLCRNVVVSELGLNEIVKQELLVFPNPASNWLELILPQQSLHQLRLMDLSGRILYQTDLQQYRATTFHIPLHYVTNGVYYVEVAGEGSIFRSKVLIVH